MLETREVRIVIALFPKKKKFGIDRVNKLITLTCKNKKVMDVKINQPCLLTPLIQKITFDKIGRTPARSRRSVVCRVVVSQLGYVTSQRIARNQPSAAVSLSFL